MPILFIDHIPGVFFSDRQICKESLVAGAVEALKSCNVGISVVAGHEVNRLDGSGCVTYSFLGLFS